MKRCPRCTQTKPLDEFHRSSKSPDGRQGYCKTCVRDDQRERAEAHPRKNRRRVPAPEGYKWCADCDTIKRLDEFANNRRTADGHAQYCKGCHNARTRETVQRRHGSTRHYHLTRRYGIGAEEVDALLAGQGGVCAICKRVPTSPHVDHCHRTGKVRGILCGPCNQGLGQFQDDVEVVGEALNYLKFHDVVTSSPFAPQIFEPPAEIYIDFVGHRAG